VWAGHISQRQAGFGEVGFQFGVAAAQFLQSTYSADFPDRFDGVAGSVGVPGSYAPVHSMICEEYTSSRRRMAPFSTLWAFSYSVTIPSLYFG
jgi:hypothetical protein